MGTEYIGFYVKTRTLLKFQARIIHEELCSAYANEVPCLSTIENGINGFAKVKKMLRTKNVLVDLLLKQR